MNDSEKAEVTLTVLEEKLNNSKGKYEEIHNICNSLRSEKESIKQETRYNEEILRKKSKIPFYIVDVVLYALFTVFTGLSLAYVCHTVELWSSILFIVTVPVVYGLATPRIWRDLDDYQKIKKALQNLDVEEMKSRNEEMKERLKVIEKELEVKEKEESLLNDEYQNILNKYVKKKEETLFDRIDEAFYNSKKLQKKLAKKREFTSV